MVHKEPWRSIDLSGLGDKEDSRRGGGVAEQRYGALGCGNSVIGRSLRTEALLLGGGRKGQFGRLADANPALIELGHESRISPVNPTSRVQFERPRTAPGPLLGVYGYRY
jgi:hypothetical protein